LQTNRTDPRRIQTLAAIVNLRQRKQSPTLADILGKLGQSTQIQTTKIVPQRYCTTHRKPPYWFTTLIQTFEPLGIPSLSLN
jgi:hypothetical protein